MGYFQKNAKKIPKSTSLIHKPLVFLTCFIPLLFLVASSLKFQPQTIFHLLWLHLPSKQIPSALHLDSIWNLQNLESIILHPPEEIPHQRRETFAPNKTFKKCGLERVERVERNPSNHVDLDIRQESLYDTNPKPRHDLFRKITTNCPWHVASCLMAPKKKCVKKNHWTPTWLSRFVCVFSGCWKNVQSKTLKVCRSKSK